MSNIKQKYVQCPKCQSELCEQKEWADMMEGPQGEVCGAEKWHCDDCDHDFFIVTSYRLRYYCIGESPDDNLADISYDPFDSIEVNGYDD